jgi:hypothetical protein
MAGYTSTDPSHLTCLAGTTAIQCVAGIVGGTTAGKPYDTVLFGVYIQENATAAVLTIGGLLDSSGNAQNLSISGETGTDYFWMPPAPILNSAGAFVFTPSITHLIWVCTRPYYGPEAPNAGGYAIR